MAEVIHLDKQRKQPPTKRETFEHGGQRYTIQFDMNAPLGQQWVWYVDYVRTYRQIGSAPTFEKAGVDARKKIHNLNKRIADRGEV